MREGSVIVDIAANSGGNCELTSLELSKGSEIISYNGVKIVSYHNFAARIAQDASKLYAKNISNLISYIFKDKNIKDAKKLDLDDEIVKAMVLTHRGEIFFGK